MQRLIAHRYEQTTVLTETDRVIFGMTLPSESTLNNIRATVDVKTPVTNDRLSADFASIYEIAGYILPLPDVDAQPQLDVLWDQLVPKQEDDDTIEMDSGVADTNPFFEPGEESMEELYSVGFQPEQIFKRRELVTAAHPSAVLYEATGPQYVYAQRHSLQTRKRYFIENPSVVVFGLSNPGLATGQDKAASPVTSLTGSNIAQLKYMTNVLERAFMDVLAITEVGAESPWEEATNLLKAHLEPKVLTDGASGSPWINESYDVHVMAMIDHSVTGRFGVGTISAGQ